MEPTQLIIAAHRGFSEIAEILLSSDEIDINRKDLEGLCALSSAFQEGHTNIAKLLLSTGNIDINNEDYSEFPILFHILFDRNEGEKKDSDIEHIKLVLSVDGLDINFQDGSGDTVLMKACYNDLKAVKLFISAEADINIQNKCGYTALMHAILGENPLEITPFLLSVDGININLKQKNGKTALNLAREHGYV